MNKHTPGPWGICKWDSKTIEARIQYLHEDDEDAEPESIVVADVYGGDLEGREADANARLIAAAPELLEALKELIAWGLESLPGEVSLGYSGIEQDIAHAKAAIAKALGE